MLAVLQNQKRGEFEMKNFMIATAVVAFCVGICVGTLATAKAQTGVALVMPSSLDAPITWSSKA
jgi:hypothetical protein